MPAGPQYRFGYGYAQELYNEVVYLEPRINTALGATSLRPGTGNFAALGDNASQTLFGAEANLGASIRFRYGTEFFLNAAVQNRNIISSSTLSFLSYAVTANLVLNTGDLKCSNSGFEAFVRAESSRAYMGGKSQQYWQFTTGVQYSFL